MQNDDAEAFLSLCNQISHLGSNIESNTNTFHKMHNKISQEYSLLYQEIQIEKDWLSQFGSKMLASEMKLSFDLLQCFWILSRSQFNCRQILSNPVSIKPVIDILIMTEDDQTKIMCFGILSNINPPLGISSSAVLYSLSLLRDAQTICQIHIYALTYIHNSSFNQEIAYFLLENEIIDILTRFITHYGNIPRILELSNLIAISLMSVVQTEIYSYISDDDAATLADAVKSNLSSCLSIELLTKIKSLYPNIQS